MDRIAKHCVVVDTHQTVKNLTEYQDACVDIHILVPHIEGDKIWCRIYKGLPMLDTLKI